MTGNELLELLRRHLPELRVALTPAQLGTLVDRLHDLQAVAGQPRPTRRALLAVRRAIPPLPQDSRLAAELDQERSPGPAAVLPDAARIADVITLLASVPWPPATEPESASLIRAVRRRLLAEPSRGTGELTGEAAESPRGARLIALPDRERGPRYPEFQFDPDTGQTRPVVRTINNLLLFQQDPWGAADWWLSPNVWLDAVPSALLGTGQDELLLQAAFALTGGA